MLMLLHWALTQASARWHWLSRLLEGPAVHLAAHGRVDTEALRRHGISEAALAQAFRNAGIRDAEEATLVVLEASGKISVLKRD